MYGEMKSVEYDNRAATAPVQSRQVSSKLDELQMEVDRMEKCYHMMTERLSAVLDDQVPGAMSSVANRIEPRSMVPLASQIDILVARIREFNANMASLAQRVEL